MLSPNQLERATPGYRRGYNDASHNRARAVTFHGVWETKDYDDGYNAALNDKRWSQEQSDYNNSVGRG